jgi:hypothetical protein
MQNIQGDSRVIMSPAKFLMQPTIHAPHSFFSFIIDYSTMILIKFDKCEVGYVD